MKKKRKLAGAHHPNPQPSCVCGAELRWTSRIGKQQNGVLGRQEILGVPTRAVAGENYIWGNSLRCEWILGSQSGLGEGSITNFLGGKATSSLPSLPAPWQ